MATSNGVSSHDASLVSHYESPLSSPAKSPSPRDCQSSLASTSLDFSYDNNNNNDHEVLYQTAVGENLLLERDSLDSTCTLVPEPSNNHNRVQLVSTNPFVVDMMCPTNEPQIEYVKILNNLNELSLQLEQIDNLEKHMAAISLQLKLTRENVARLQRDSCVMIQKLIDSRQSTTPQAMMCNAQTQTDFQSQRIIDMTNSHEPSISDNNNNPAGISLPTDMRHRFRKLPALVKGYLVRRLMQVEEVQQLKQTICDTSIILRHFKSNLFRNGKLVVTHQDIEFHKRLCIQLEKSCQKFYAIFFETPIGKQMNMVKHHREYMKSIVYLNEKRTKSVLSTSSSRASFVSRRSYYQNNSSKNNNNNNTKLSKSASHI